MVKWRNDGFCWSCCPPMLYFTPQVRAFHFLIIMKMPARLTTSHNRLGTKYGQVRNNTMTNSDTSEENREGIYLRVRVCRTVLARDFIYSELNHEDLLRPRPRCWCTGEAVPLIAPLFSLRRRVTLCMSFKED